MIVNQAEYNLVSPGSKKHVELLCDSNRNAKCLGYFSREKRIAVAQRLRTSNKDYCKFCQKTEEFSGRGNPNTKYFFDDDFLNIIDTPEKAYLLGWIASDGSISTNSIRIEIRDYDIVCLKQLRDIINSNIPIAERHNMVSITINSKQIAEACLKHLGLLYAGKKDARIKYPELPSCLDVYFIRGYFEGDGSVHTHNRIPRVSIGSNSLSMLHSIKEKCGLGQVYTTASSGVNQWECTKGAEAIKFLEYIYEDREAPVLYRKYNKYQDISAWVPSKTGGGTSIKFNTTSGLIKFNKARPDAILPAVSDIHASGIDLHIVEKIKDFTEDVSLYTTGIKAQPPEGYYFILVGRSSISKSGYSLANGIGIIDENYIGEILVPLRRHSNNSILELPMRIVQLVLLPKINCELTIVDSLENTDRGTGGFGSTGIK